MAQNNLKAVKDNGEQEQKQRRSTWNTLLAFGAGAVGLAAASWISYSERSYQHKRKEKLSYCETEFVPAEELINSGQLEEGDLIEFLRAVYQHWAIYIGNGYVIHLTNSGSISRARLIDVGRDQKCRINLVQKKASELGLRPRGSRQDIVEYALSQVDSTVKYRLVGYNCEDFATECFYGKAFSDQADTLNGNRTVKAFAKMGASLHPYE